MQLCNPFPLCAVLSTALHCIPPHCTALPACSCSSRLGTCLLVWSSIFETLLGLNLPRRDVRFGASSIESGLIYCGQMKSRLTPRLCFRKSFWIYCIIFLSLIACFRLILRSGVIDVQSQSFLVVKKTDGDKNNATFHAYKPSQNTRRHNRSDAPLTFGYIEAMDLPQQVVHFYLFIKVSMMNRSYLKRLATALRCVLSCLVIAL